MSREIKNFDFCIQSEIVSYLKIDMDSMKVKYEKIDNEETKVAFVLDMFMTLLPIVKNDMKMLFYFMIRLMISMKDETNWDSDLRYNGFKMLYEIVMAGRETYSRFIGTKIYNQLIESVYNIRYFKVVRKFFDGKKEIELIQTDEYDSFIDKNFSIYECEYLMNFYPENIIF